MSASNHVSRILVGVDEREHAVHAVEAGIHLAEACGAELELVHAVPLPQPLRGGGAMSRWIDTSSALIDWAREHVLTRVGQALANVAPERDADALTTLSTGKPATVLVEHARKIEADLIVLGGHAKHGILDFGNTARAILSATPVPVWVQPNAWSGIQRLLVPVDAADEAQAVFRVARSMAKSLAARVEVLHAFQAPYFAYSPEVPPEVMPTYVVDEMRTEDHERFDSLYSDFDWEGVEVSAHWLEGSPAESILAQAGSSDLIVMGTHGRSAFLAAVLGSEAWQVLKRAPTPVLMVPLHPH